MADEPWIAISGDGKEVARLDDLLVVKRGFLLERILEETRGVPGSEGLEEKLDAQENTLLIAQAELSQLRSDIFAEEDELRKLRDRPDFIKADIERNRDIKQLRDSVNAIKEQERYERGHPEYKNERARCS